MSYRTVNLMAYFGIAIVCFIVQRSVVGIPDMIPDDVGTGFFPAMLAWLTIGLCLLGALKTILTGPGDLFLINNGQRIAITFGAVAIFILSWKSFGFFYIQEFVFLFALFTIYRIPLGLNPQRLGLNAAAALGITAFCFLVFNQLIYVDL